MSLRTDVIYRVIESPTTHVYIVIREEFGETVEVDFYSAKRARQLSGREEIVSITREDYDALKGRPDEHPHDYGYYEEN